MYVKLFPYVMYTIAAAIIFPLLMQIVLLPILFLPLLPGLTMYTSFFSPEFVLSLEQDVKHDAFGVSLNSEIAWLFYSGFILVLGFCITLIKLVTLMIPKLNNTRTLVLLIILFTFMIPQLYNLYFGIQM